MGNLKAAALACGVVASVLGGGLGVTYITSTTIRTADLVTEENAGVTNIDGAVSSTSATADATEKATAKNGTTTKKSNMADGISATSKFSGSAQQEGTTSQYSTEAASKAAKISRSVPAPAHAPAAITQPATQPATTATMIVTAADVVRETTSALIAEISSTTTQATTTTTTTATTTSTTTTSTTTVAATAETTTTAEPATEAPEVTTETYVEPVTEPESIDVESSDFVLPISQEEYILLCNAVGHEAGSNWITDYNKAYVVEVIMNRKNSPGFPNTIYDVLTQYGQFSGAWSYVDLGTYSSRVTQSVKDAVTLYFMEPESFTQGYLYFTGVNGQNVFRTTY